MFGSRSVVLLALAGACAFAQPPHRGMGAPPPGGPGGDFAFMHAEFGGAHRAHAPFQFGNLASSFA